MKTVDHDTLHDLLEPRSTNHMQSLIPNGPILWRSDHRFWWLEVFVHRCWAEKRS